MRGEGCHGREPGGEGGEVRVGAGQARHLGHVKGLECQQPRAARPLPLPLPLRARLVLGLPRLDVGGNGGHRLRGSNARFPRLAGEVPADLEVQGDGGECTGHATAYRPSTRPTSYLAAPERAVAAGGLGLRF